MLYVNSHMLMIDRSQARNSYEYIQALRDTISTASVPGIFGASSRAIRCVVLFAAILEHPYFTLIPPFPALYVYHQVRPLQQYQFD